VELSAGRYLCVEELRFPVERALALTRRSELFILAIYPALDPGIDLGIDPGIDPGASVRGECKWITNFINCGIFAHD
jgi:hypothetical protein